MTFMAIALFMKRFPTNWPNVVLSRLYYYHLQKGRCRLHEKSVDVEIGMQSNLDVVQSVTLNMERIACGRDFKS